MSHPTTPPDAGTLAALRRPEERIDGRAKVTGTARYAADLAMPGMLHAAFVTSPHPHARIVSVSVDQARSMPGVHAVLTGKDLPVPYGILPVSQDEHALCLDKVRFIGDPVAAVAAVDEETAWEACRQIEVEYRELQPVASIEDAPLLLERCCRIAGTRERLFALLDGIAWIQAYPSQANFILCRLDGVDAVEVQARLAKRGIFVRHFDTPALRNHLRISVGLEEHSQRVVTALREIGAELGR